jgi:TolB-like protein
VETIPKVGFRLIPGVTDPPVDGNPVEAPSVLGRRTRWNLLAVLVLVIVVAGITWRLPPKPAEGPVSLAEEAKSLAVLPFADLSPERDQAYFADGLAEELIDRLSRLEGLTVASRTDAFQFRDNDRDLVAIASDLRVRYLLEGSVRKDQDQLRITTRLVDASSGYPAWSDTYDRSLAEIFVVQEEIAEAVAIALSIKLDVGELGLDPRATSNVKAHDEFLQAKALQWEFTADSILLAISHARRAVEIDPDFAYGWYMLAGLYREAGTFKRAIPEENWKQLSAEALKRAAELDPNPRAGWAERVVLAKLEQRWSDVQEMLGPLTGKELVENDVHTFHYAYFLYDVGRVREAIPLMEHWLRVHPQSQGAAVGLASMYSAQGRYDEAFAAAERALETGGYSDISAITGNTVALCADDQEQLAKWLPRRLQHTEKEAIELLQAMSETLDDRLAALAALRTVDSDILAYEVSIWAAWHGDVELALEAMRRSDTTFAFWLPIMKDVRRHPGFKELASDMNLVDYWHEYGWSDFCRPVGEDDFACE